MAWPVFFYDLIRTELKKKISGGGLTFGPPQYLYHGYALDHTDIKFYKPLYGVTTGNTVRLNSTEVLNQNKTFVPLVGYLIAEVESNELHLLALL